VSADRDDTDPAVADTQTSDPGEDSKSDEPKRGAKVARAVHVGDVLGRYELVEEIGEGGMATVYRAKDRDLRREVAIKVLFPHLSRRPEIVRRFHREARAAASLEHDNILRIYDVGGGEEEPPYIVMELIKGRTLLQEVEQRGPVLAEVVACIGALLAAAHSAGIIHRDIKPANVLIAPGGRLLLADFGVARLETEDSLVTRTGALLGTPAYMSPEQASGETATARSDLYSLGATLYQLATGSLPYTGSPAKVMAQIASGSLISPLRRRPAVGPDLSRAIERLMETEIISRPANAAVAAEDLRAIAIAGGLGKPTEELSAYFDDPEQFLRVRTPTVVTAIVTAARHAVTESKLPRAMALADRASALAPDDPTVSALVETVTEGGRSSRRRRVLLIGALGAAVLGGGTGLVMMLRGGSPVVIADASAIAVVHIDAVSLDVAAIPTSTVFDAEPPDAPIATPDASHARDATTIKKPDAAVDASVTIDAAVSLSLDATVVPAAPDAALEPGAIIVKNDLYCDIKIDGVSYGEKRNVPLRVTAGRHTVICEHAPTTWTETVDIASGETRTLEHEMIKSVDVTIALTKASSIEIDGTRFPATGRTTLKATRHFFEVPGAKKWLTLTASCVVRDQPELDCYR
jgi:serine/threonine-protein kinase